MSWPIIKVGSLCRLTNGRAFKPSDWSSTGVPIIRIQNLNDPNKAFNYWAGSLDHQVDVEPGDVLLAWSGTPGTSFGAHIWNGPSGILNQHIFLVDVDQSQITKKWFVLAVNFKLNRLIALAHGGVGLKHVTRGMVDSLEIPLPPLDEQRRIATILGEADGLRLKRMLSLSRVDALATSLFFSTFGDPASNAKRWKEDSLGMICTKITDGTHRSPPVTISGVPYVTAKHLRPTGLDFFSDPWFISQEDHNEIYARCDPKVGDVLYIKDGATAGIAAINYYNFEFSMLSSLALLRTNPNKCVPEYLVTVLNYPSMKAKILRDMAGAAIRRLTLAKINEIRLPVPPLSLQQTYAVAHTKLLDVRRSQSDQLAQFNELFAALQMRAFSGDLPIPSAFGKAAAE